MPSRMKLFGKNRVEIIGDVAIRRVLKSLGSRVRRQLVVPAMEDAMRPMLNRAKTEVAQDTGRMRESLVESTKGQEKGRMLVDVAITKIPYAGFEEYGTRAHAPDHAMLRTFDAQKKASIDVAMTKIRDGIERLASGS